MSDSAAAPKIVKEGDVYYVEGRPREEVKVIAHHHPPNIPGKSLIVMLVDQPPNAASPPHTHGGATVLGLTMQGQVLNQMNSSPEFIVNPGECWYEAPGCHHVKGENMSKEENSKFFAVFIVDDELIKDGYQNLLVVDQAVEDAKK